MPQSALQECEEVIASIANKADKNKQRSRVSVIFLTAATALIPIFILLSTHYFEFLLGKVIPSALAASAAIGAGLVQIERPHERWNLYRRYQRILEAEKLKYVHHADEYGESSNPDELLIQRLAQLQIDLHHEWAGLIPTSSEVSSLGRSAPA